MRTRARDATALAFAGLLVALSASAASANVGSTDEVPLLRARVNDYAGILPADRAAALETRLAEYEQRTGRQLALLTVKSLGGEPIEDYSMRVVERWKLGRKGEDNGLLLLVCPSEHKMRIEVGYGLEGVFPDALASRVIREVLVPSFRGGDYAGGIDAAFAILMHEGGIKPPPPQAAHAERSGGHSLLLWLPVLLWLFFVFSRVGNRRRYYGMGGFGGYGGGSFGGGGFGGFGGGSGGGGGFSGGGGGFGGGGASGSW